MSRMIALAEAVRDNVLALPNESLGRRLEVVIPDDPSIWAESPEPTLLIVPIGDVRDRARASVVRRAAVNLLFAGPLEVGFGKTDWLDLVEGLIDALEFARLGPFHPRSIEAETVWDPAAQGAGRFAALYRLTATRELALRG